jgi:dihydrolipoamide dehydrogenase
MPENSYDVAVLGSGTGGYSTALRAAQLGKRVALIEKDDRLGGTCLIRGCIPTKALLQAAAVMDSISHAETWGIKASGEPEWDSVLAFKTKIVDKLVSGVTGLVKGRKIDVVQGSGKLVGGPAIEVDGRRIEATDVVLASGSFARLLPGMEISDRVITSDQALELDYIPGSAVVIGAGAVGLEFASFYRSMGAEVTVVEALPRLAPLEDEEISKELDRAFRKRGIKSFVGAKVQDVKEAGAAVEVTYDDAKGQTQTVSADICLVAVGRGPVSDGLGYEEAGVQLERGYVKVDGSLQTAAPHVWAVGDLAATPFQLAHVSFAEGIAVAERISGMEVPDIDYAGVCRVTYCSPEVASVGLTEAQARERGYDDLEIEKLHMQAIGKANILAEGGVVKVVAAKGGPVLGIHLIGPHVTDLVAEAMLITNWEALPSEVAALIHPHPSLSEAIGEAHLALAGKSLHTP